MSDAYVLMLSIAVGLVVGIWLAFLLSYWLERISREKRRALLQRVEKLVQH